MSITHTQTDLLPLLQRVFGHSGFRTHQQTVCEVAAEGRDVLLVMPTGAGKSLCYQLPALARRQTPGASPALVISPLIALMDDQASKLEALGLRVARIHSGLSRVEARAASRAYLTGELDFLFIAPERLRVPGFPEMLARRKPSLLAIDEAHCISQWGHDFRPDYRMLGHHLPALRPSPVIALTATATPEVQRDIALQLGLQDPAVFITGFRRENLAIEVIELSKPQRASFVSKLLNKPETRPAIVYAPSRKSAEELATQLQQHFPAAAYHAGLDGVSRERVQRAFLAGSIEVVVATIAFGMGIDKANVRTVIHTALPGSLEAYYQEIGRAGRDGLPSRTVLLHSFADRKTHEFFLERAYPPLSELKRVSEVVRKGGADESISAEQLGRALKLEREAVERSLEKLLGLGLIDLDATGAARMVGSLGSSVWESSYEKQIAGRHDQIDRMVAFAEASQCRMAALIEHFGDREDTRGACGRCDICAPEAVSSQTRHQPDPEERKVLATILKALSVRSYSTGKLFSELHLTRGRKQFEMYLDALARAALIVLESETFRTEDGRDVAYRKAIITAEGRTPDEATLSTVWLAGDNEGKKDVGSAGAKSRKQKTQVRGSGVEGEAIMLTPAGEQIFQKLREWRVGKAKSLGKPAFFLFGDRVLRAIAASAPRTPAALEQVSGVGTGKVEQYGADVLRICAGVEALATFPTVPEVDATPKAKRPSFTPTRTSRAPGNGASDRIRRSVTAPTAVAGRQPSPIPDELSPDGKEREARLREWRSSEARREGLPSFFILSDSALRQVAHVAPQNIKVLQETRGFDQSKLSLYGETILELCRT